MKPKIIIADDSQTVQKVVKIYMAKLEEDPSFKYELEIIECMEESSLVSMVHEHQPRLVLLDFNLSKNKTGYDLAKEIKDICQPKILMLFGSFDTIDESLFDAAGVNGHNVMPFDGVKILSQLQQLLDDGEEDSSGEAISVQEHSEDSQDSEYDDEYGDDENFELESLDEFSEDDTEAPTSDDISLDEISIDDSWVVEQPEVKEAVELESDEIVTDEEINTLEAGMEDWGIKVPSVIGADDFAFEVPPVIGLRKERAETVYDEDDLTSEFNLASIQEANKQDEEEEIYPSDSDLEYPEVEKSDHEELNSSQRPSFISLEELNVDLEENQESQDSTSGMKEIGLGDTLGTSTAEEVRALEEQISDEVEITSTYKMKDLWGSDEVESSTEDEEQGPFVVEKESQQVETKIELSEEDISAKVNELLEPMVERIVREKVDRILEKISWEVLPDLAENLIKKELKVITNEVLNK